MNEFEKDDKDRTIASLQAEIDRLKGATKVCSPTEFSADEKKDDSSTKEITEAEPKEPPLAPTSPGAHHGSRDYPSHYQRNGEDRRKRDEDREDRRYQHELERERKQERVSEDKEKVHQAVQSALTGVMNFFQKGSEKKDDGEKKK